MRVAAVAWEIRSLRSEAEFYDRIAEIMNTASECDAEMVVCPELFLMELLFLHPNREEADVPKILARYAHRFQATCCSLARVTKTAIIAGSHIAEDMTNVSLAAWPDGRHSIHPKNVLTRWEADEWGLQPGAGLPECPDPRIGITICYDSEFPEAGRILADRGVLVQVVPSFTETRRGYQRVRWSCQARAIENQTFVIHTSLLGSLGREPVPTTYGTSAVLTPSVEPFHHSCVLAESPLNEAGLVFADLDFEALLACRENGDVRNFHDRHAGRWVATEVPMP